LRLMKLLAILPGMAMLTWAAGSPGQRPAGRGLERLFAAAQQEARGQGRLAIIVNRSNPIDNLSSIQLRKIFLAEQVHWPNGRKITVVMREPGEPEREAVLRVIYHMNENDFSRYFLHGTYTGEMQSVPKTLATAGGMRKFVFNVPGAIGYVRANEVDESVKLVRVDGLAPVEQGYKLVLPAR
jgi:phosphate transport system substrate-binding protein